jgi:hypothetical protein
MAQVFALDKQRRWKEGCENGWGVSCVFFFLFLFSLSFMIIISFSRCMEQEQGGCKGECGSLWLRFLLWTEAVSRIWTSRGGELNRVASKRLDRGGEPGIFCSNISSFSLVSKATRQLVVLLWLSFHFLSLKPFQTKQ